MNGCEKNPDRKKKGKDLKEPNIASLKVITLNRGCIKTVFIIDNFCLKVYIFYHNAWFTFCHVFRMSITYKIGQNNFDASSEPLLRNPKVPSVWCKIFLIWCKTYMIGCKILNAWCRAFCVWCKLLNAWCKTFLCLV